MSLTDKILSLSPEQKTVYMVMRSMGTNLKTIYANVQKPKPSVRRIITELKQLGLVVDGSKRGFYRLIVEDTV